MQPSDASAPARAPQTPITWLLIAANVAMFAVELASGADIMRPTSQQILHLGGDFAPLTLHGQWWRLGSSMFLHIGIVHLAMNMIVLWQARVVELLYGRLGFFAIYLASGLLGGLASLSHAKWAVSAGASGAVFGVFGAFGAFLLARRDRIDPEVLRRRAQSLATFIGINLIYGWMQPHIDVSAHIGGLITGFVVGLALAHGARGAEQVTKRAIPALAAALVLTVAGLLLLPKPLDVTSELAAFNAVEQQCVATFNAAHDQLKANAITGEQMVEVIEKQVLPPWRAARARIEGLHDVPPGLAHALQLLVQYAKDRDQSFVDDETLADGTPTREFVERHDQLQRKIKEDLEAYSAALRP